MRNIIDKLFRRRVDKIIGIDIGTGSLKFAEVLHKERPVLNNLAVMDFPQGMSENPIVNNVDVLNELLAKAIHTFGFTAKHAVLAVNSRTAFAREVYFPKMTDVELKEAVKWEIDKYVPYESDTYYYDYAVVGKGRNELEMKVLLSAAPKDIIDHLGNLFKSVGIIPVAIEIEPLALARTITNIKNAVIVDIGELTSQITLFHNSSPAVMRSVALGGRRFTDIIANTLELDFLEAERFKCNQQGLLRSNEGNNDVDNLYVQIEMLAVELIQEVRRTIEYYQAQNPDVNIEKIILTGGGSNLDGIIEYMSSQLNTSLAVHNPLSVVSVKAAIDMKYLQKNSQQMAVAIGLALRGGGE